MDLFSESSDLPMFGNYSAQLHSCGRGYMIAVPYGELIYIPAFIEKKISDRSMEVFLANNLYDWKNTDWQHVQNLDNVVWKNIQWKQDTISMFGKQHDLPRLTAWYGDEGNNYTYSGILSCPHPWNPALLWLKQQLTQICDTPFNSVLMNWYRDGQDYLSWHDDAEPELGKNPTIGSLNFGESRRFLLRRKDDHHDKIELNLGHGDVLIMSGALQHYWQHSVPKQAKVKGNRINLTFRYILQD